MQNNAIVANSVGGMYVHVFHKKKILKENKKFGA
jgi:hypothetical protein